MPKSISTKELIRERDLMKERLDRLDYRIQNRKSRVMNKHILSAIGHRIIPLAEGSSEQLKYIVKVLGNGEDTVIDNIAINGADQAFETFTPVLYHVADLGYIEKTVWAYSHNGYKKVNLDKFEKLVEQVNLGMEFPYNMATGEDIEDTENWISDNYQYIWLPTVKYKELLETSYNKFLEDTQDD